MNYQIALWIVGGIITVIGTVCFFIKRKENRRRAEIKEVKDTFAKRIGIPQRYFEAYETAKTERDVIDVAILVAQSRNVCGTSTYLKAYVRGIMPFGKVMRSLAASINNADKNTKANHGAKEAGLPTSIFRGRVVVRPWHENYTDLDQSAGRRVNAGTRDRTERYRDNRRHDNDVSDDYTLPAAAAVFTATHFSSSCNTGSYESGHACDRPTSSYYGGGGSSDSSGSYDCSSSSSGGSSGGGDD